MTTPLNITSLKQGKLHKNYDELCADALAQRDFLIRMTGIATLRRVLAAAKKLLNPVYAKFHTAHRVSSVLGSLHRP